MVFWYFFYTQTVIISILLGGLWILRILFWWISFWTFGHCLFQIITIDRILYFLSQFWPLGFLFRVWWWVGYFNLILILKMLFSFHCLFFYLFNFIFLFPFLFLPLLLFLSILFLLLFFPLLLLLCFLFFPFLLFLFLLLFPMLFLSLFFTQ